MPNRAPCGGDAYQPWGTIPRPKSGDERTCGTCAHATREAAERDINRTTGTIITGVVPGPFGKCLGAAGLGLLREMKR